IAINNIVIVSAGARAPAYNEQDGTQALREDDININIDLQAGAAKAHCYGCDLTAEYVRINADYRS
ncbi:MAG: bifunctional ornithine acetyltransferase/N-acetylglutamate synthase, partial [Proteobacteria bacterium]|nr:bifunctional ornithine acetyltransferase/N-acetylglutamate synthase [Pseudomonadota bacterium]